MLNENSAIEYTARAFAVLTYYKLCDDMSDEKGLKKVGATVMKPIAASANAKAELGVLSDIVKDGLDKISALEKENCPSVDKPAALFGDLLGEIFASGLDEKDALVPREVGRHLGRFIYAADAAEDYESDREEGKYNPFVLLYGGKPLTKENRESIKCGLLLECRALESAVNLLPFGSRATIENIINNIIYLGLVKRIEFLDGEKDKKNKKETSH